MSESPETPPPDLSRPDPFHPSPFTLHPSAPSRRKPFLWGCAIGSIFMPVFLVVGGVALTYFKPVHDFVVASERAKLKTAALSSGIAGDFSLKLEQVDGAPLALESLKGKPLFLHFWSPACPHCLAELPGLNRLYQSLAGSDVVFVAVAIAGFDELPQVARENGIKFPLYSCKSALPGAYQGGSAPITIILSPSGDIVLRHFGSAKWDSPAVTALLKGLSAFTPQPPTPVP